MTQQMMASGRIKHKNMNLEAVKTRVRERFPKLEESDGDFAIPLVDCRAVLWCQHNKELLFKVAPQENNGTNRAVTEIELLAPSTDSLWEGLRDSLKYGLYGRYPALTQCCIEDRRSKAKLLIRDPVPSPLRSPGAKVAYIMSILFGVACAALVVWQLHLHQSRDTRVANILAIALATGVAAVSMPVPILINWRDRKKTSTWRYARVE